MDRRRTAQVQVLAPRPVLSGAAAAWLLIALAALVLSPFGAAPARASAAGPTAEGAVPADVRAQFQGQALRRAVSTPATDLMGEVRAGTIHQVFVYSADFVDGSTTAEPVTPLQEWVAGIEGDGAPVGWLRVWKPDGDPAQPTGYNADPEVGRAMVATTASAVVEVPWDASFFTLVDGVVAPVHLSERAEGARASSLAEVQQAFAEARGERVDCGGEACVGGGGWSSAIDTGAARPLAWAGAAVLVLSGGAFVVLRRRRPRSDHTVTAES